MKTNWPRVSSPLLHQFYVEWDEWANGEIVQDTRVFKTNAGLCPCLAASRHIAKYFEERRALAREMKSQFIDAGLCIVFPFGEDAYEMMRSNGTLYRCPLRRAWVKQRITDYEEYHNANKKQ